MLPGFRCDNLAKMTLLLAVMGPLGDLCASALKRRLEIKDFGAIMPGHGASWIVRTASFLRFLPPFITSSFACGPFRNEGNLHPRIYGLHRSSDSGVVRLHPTRFKVAGLAAGSNVALWSNR